MQYLHMGPVKDKKAQFLDLPKTIMYCFCKRNFESQSTVSIVFHAFSNSNSLQVIYTHISQKL